jgi:hypothetical protein
VFAAAGGWILGGMRAAFLPILLLTATNLIACGGSDSSGEPSQRVYPERSVLGLSDLHRGYRIGDDTSCVRPGTPGGGEVGVEGGNPRFRDLILEQRPVACNMQLELLYETHGSRDQPPLIESIALVFATDEGADDGLGIARDVIAYMTGEEELREAPLDAELGEEASAFSTDDALVEGRTGQRGFAIAWRSGRVLAAVFVGGLPGSAGEHAAVSLAEQQQGHIDAPEPIEPTEQDDREVALENPDLGIDVYWLGRTFSPGGGLPDIALYDAAGPLGPGGVPGTWSRSTTREE